MPKYTDIQQVLALGSGPTALRQAAESDHAGTQACRALKEEGLEVVLINSNPATIMTDKDIADHVYIEPMNLPSITQVIEKERPDALLPNMGGQTGLNLAMALYENGTLEKYGVRLLGTSPASIHKAEDRQGFKDCMESIGQPCVTSKVVNTVEDAVSFTNEIGYPVIVRPAYTLGGTGGGIAYDEVSLREISDRGLNLSRVHEVLIERCIAGWKEIEFEVMRDSAGNVIQICSMENIDPVGVHTGDSIVVAPTQTLANREFQMLRSAALDIISALEIEGGCNVQFALNPDSYEYAVIEVNPRVSRSSALASKATGYPIAKVAAKVALGYTLDEIPNAVTGKTTACFEPTIDYCVLKIPRLPFDKFTTASRTLGTQMKATGEVMAIANSFEGALMKAIRSLELNVRALKLDKLEGLYTDEIEDLLVQVTDERLFVVAEALRRELDRGGQAYYIHNRIDTIDQCAAKLAELLPGARIATAHGRMDEATLSGVWQKLLDGEIDVLVCTTLIETGVDVRNCNTLIIEDADRMGLAQLYQIRGRVGRSGRKAYAYFTFRRDKVLTDIAAKRLSAIREFTSFGSGFRIAMRDLQIRGAGSLLGHSQHGHMEAVGYDLYVKMLGQAIARAKGEPVQRDKSECLIDLRVDAYIPEKYIADGPGRIEAYKRIAAIQTPEDAADVLDELIDRYGDPPPSVSDLVNVSLARVQATAVGVYEVTQKKDTLVLQVEQLDLRMIQGLLVAFNGRVVTGAGAKPYLSVTLQKEEKPLELLQSILRAMQDILKD